MNSSYAVHFNVDCPVIIVRGIMGKQRENDQLVYRVDWRDWKWNSHGRPASFESVKKSLSKHSLDAYYRNWVYGALTTRYLISTGHTNRLRKKTRWMYLLIPHCASSYLPSSSASRWKRPKTTLGSDSTIDIIPTPPPWWIRHTTRNIASRARGRERRAYQTSSEMTMSTCASCNTCGTGSRAPHWIVRAIRLIWRVGRRRRTAHRRGGYGQWRVVKWIWHAPFAASRGWHGRGYFS